MVPFLIVVACVLVALAVGMCVKSKRATPVPYKSPEPMRRVTIHDVAHQQGFDPASNLHLTQDGTAPPAAAQPSRGAPNPNRSSDGDRTPQIFTHSEPQTAFGDEKIVYDRTWAQGEKRSRRARPTSLKRKDSNTSDKASHSVTSSTATLTASEPLPSSVLEDQREMSRRRHSSTSLHSTSSHASRSARSIGSSTLDLASDLPPPPVPLTARPSQDSNTVAAVQWIPPPLSAGHADATQTTKNSDNETANAIATTTDRTSVTVDDKQEDRSPQEDDQAYAIPVLESEWAEMAGSKEFDAAADH